MKPPYVFVNPKEYLEQSPCPVCGHALTGITSVSLDKPKDPEDWKPSKNSFSICAYCAAILRFEADGCTLRGASSTDLLELVAADPEVFNLLQDLTGVTRELIQSRRRKKYKAN